MSDDTGSTHLALVRDSVKSVDFYRRYAGCG